MKKFCMYLSIFAMLFISIANVQAQVQTPAKPSPEQYLTADQMAKYQADVQIAELEKKLQTYGNWVGVGGEIGIAVREGLSAVVEVSDQFGKTDVGRFTMIMIAWKIMGDSVFGFAFGLLYFIVSTIVFVRIFKRLIKPRKMIIENPGFLRYPKKYEIIPAPFDNVDSVGVASILFAVIMIVNIGITCAIMF